MGKEQFIKQRRMANFTDPYCAFKIGDIFVDGNDIDVEKYQVFDKKGKNGFLYLKWWEAIKIKDMPKYLISSRWKRFATKPLCESGIISKITKEHNPIYKVKEYLTTGFIDEKGIVRYFDIEGSFPSSKEEYNQYKSIFVKK